MDVTLTSTIQPVLQGIGLTKHYPASGLLRRLSRKPQMRPPDALADVSFEVYPGEMVGLLGPNGAGKTTLLKIASTMLYPSSGEVRICGENVQKDPIRMRRKIGLITSDERSFYWRLTGRQNLEFFAALYDVPKPETPARIQRLLNNLSLAHAADKPFYTYSSGMKQKMAIGRGLIGDPSVVLYDEPTRALDPLSTRTIREWLKENQRKSTNSAHLIATNQMDEAEQLCDRIIVLNRGRVVAAGTITEIRDKLQEHEVHRIACRGRVSEASLRAGQCKDVLNISVTETDSAIEVRVHTMKSSAGLSHVLEQILAHGGTVVRCDTVEMPLEEVICSLISQDQPAEAVAAGGVL